MKNAVIAALSLALAAPLAVAQEPLKSLDTKEQKSSYSFGLMLGKRLKEELPEIQTDVFVQGFRAGYTGEKALLTDQQVEQVLTDYQNEQRQKQMEEFEKLAGENLKKGEDFLKENGKKKGVKTTESGLQYKIITEGKGASPKSEDTVKVHYTGKLVDGTVFDSSVQRGEPVTFPVNGVIPGWTEALQKMKPGAKWEIYIPADLAYGPGGNRAIGPNEVLIFEVELLEVVKNDSKDAAKK